MQNLSTFQLVVLGICGALVFVGVVLFATLNRFSGTSVGTVTVWGTLPQNTVDKVLQTERGNNRSFQNVTYVEKDPATFNTDLLNAIASGKAPDLVILTQENIFPFKDKLDLIPYTAVSQSQYQSSFIDESNLFLTSQGILAMPLAVDPLVLYWNKDLLAGAGIAQAPVNWNDLTTSSSTSEVQTLTVLSSSKDIQKSAIAMGTWNNITDAKAILSALMMQAGDPIVSFDQSGKTVPVFGTTHSGSIESPASSALRFYTDFADPSKTSYSWNRILPLSQEAFASGDLALYVGFASEYPIIAARNPNLNFGLARLPQPEGIATPITYGRLYGLAIPRGSSNPNGALAIAQLLSQDAPVAALAAALNIAPARRDLITTVANDAAATTIMQSALIARGWLDPDAVQTDAIFGSMVESVLSGQYQPSEAVANAALTFQRLFPQQ